MVWVQRIVALVFVLGVVSLVGAIILQVGQAEGVPPLPVFLGLLGIVALILAAASCLALVSLAISARRGADALHRLSAHQGHAPARGFTAPPLSEASAHPDAAPPAVASSDRPIRPAGRTLVASRQGRKAS